MSSEVFPKWFDPNKKPDVTDPIFTQWGGFKRIWDSMSRNGAEPPTTNQPPEEERIQSPSLQTRTTGGDTRDRRHLTARDYQRQVEADQNRYYREAEQRRKEEEAQRERNLEAQKLYSQALSAKKRHNELPPDPPSNPTTSQLQQYRKQINQYIETCNKSESGLRHMLRLMMYPLIQTSQRFVETGADAAKDGAKYLAGELEAGVGGITRDVVHTAVGLAQTLADPGEEDRESFKRKVQTLVGKGANDENTGRGFWGTALDILTNQDQWTPAEVWAALGGDGKSVEDAIMRKKGEDGLNFYQNKGSTEFARQYELQKPS